MDNEKSTLKCITCGATIEEVLWIDIAHINGKYYPVSETVTVYDSTMESHPFDFDGLYEKLSEKHNVSRDEIELLSEFILDKIPLHIVDEIYGEEEFGGYCPIYKGVQ